MLSVIGIIVVIGGVVFFHELGHFVFAKLSGMRVETFSLGFPPKLISKKIGETEYCISAIPLGGFVKVSGVIDESMDTEKAGDTEDPKSFATKSIPKKLSFISGGVLFNIFFAFIIFAILVAFTGIYEPNPAPVVAQVVPDMPADSVGIAAGDSILAVNGIATPTWSKMTEIIHARPRDTVHIKFQRATEIYTRSVPTVQQKIMRDGQLVNVGMIGISPQQTHRSAGFFEVLGHGAANTWYWLKVTVISLKSLMTGEASFKNLGGPIFIAKLAGESAKSGLSSLVGLMAIISINLALINILPIPALDGGHFVIVTIEGIIKRPLSNTTKIRIQQIGMVIILILMVLVFYNDILRLIRGF